MIYSENDLMVALPGGSKTNECGKLTSGHGPFSSVEAARDAIRKLRANGKCTEKVNIWIREGVYALNETLFFTSEDSNACYKAYPGEKVIFSGGVAVENWQESKLGKKRLWTADVSGIMKQAGAFKQLFIDGKRCPRNRFPKTGFLKLGDITPDIKKELFDGTDKIVVEQKNELLPIKSFKNVELIALHFWIEERLPVKSFDPETGVITSSRRTRFSVAGDKNIGYLENVAEAFTDAGEWYLDEDKAVLHYLPRKHEKLGVTRAVIPKLKQLLRLDGEPHTNNYVENLHFENIEFQYSAWIQPDWGAKRFHPNLPRSKWRTNCACKWDQNYEKNELYGAMPQGAVDIPGVIYLEGAKNCAISGCELKHLGWYGIELADGCSGNQITGNTICDMGAGGIKVGGEQDAANKNELTFDNTIADNHIFSGGHVYMSALGIGLFHTFGNLVAHNHLHDLKYTGISCGWVWGYGDNVTRENRIEKNHIHHIGDGSLSDMGGIYLLGVQPGTRISGNLIHDIRKYYYGGWGIYTDEGSSHIVIENNICYNLDSQGFHQHFGRENIIRNNIFVSGREGAAALTQGTGRNTGFEHPGVNSTCAATFCNNIFVTNGTPFFFNPNKESMAYLNKEFFSDLNLFWDISQKNILLGVGDFEKVEKTYSLKKWRMLGFDLKSLFGNPKFKNLNKFDFRLRKSSPAFKLGFKPVDMSDVGISSETT
ncbi:MAG: right-handed parallel beta-helix repeat-containing protein [Victivallaceae bacterium]